jgi:hypothetical protein
VGVTDDVRDALALRRHARRQDWFRSAPKADLVSVRQGNAVARAKGVAGWKQVLGLPAYIPDPPLPLP